VDYLQLGWDRICLESFNNIRCHKSRKFLHLWVNSVWGWLFFYTGSVVHAGPWHPAGSISSFSIPSYFSQASKTNLIQIIFNIIKPALLWLFNGILSTCPNSLIKRFSLQLNACNFYCLKSCYWCVIPINTIAESEISYIHNSNSFPSYFLQGTYPNFILL
jgi:hypothetical protein